MAAKDIYSGYPFNNKWLSGVLFAGNLYLIVLTSENKTAETRKLLLELAGECIV